MGESGSRSGFPYSFIRPELSHCHPWPGGMPRVSTGHQPAANSKNAVRDRAADC